MKVDPSGLKTPAARTYSEVPFGNIRRQSGVFSSMRGRSSRLVTTRRYPCVGMAIKGRRRENGNDEPVELAALADGSLPPAQRAELERRVADSPELAERLAEQHQSLALTRHAIGGVEAPAQLRAGLAPKPSRNRRPARGLVLAAAAALAAAAVIGGVALRSGGTSAQFRAALAPTSLAPAATGEATLTRRPSGWRIELAATGLPRLDGGRFYEAWLRSQAGVLIPVGTFNDGRSVTLWSGVAPDRSMTLTVTRERADGDQGSSGEKVLAGSVRASGS